MELYDKRVSYWIQFGIILHPTARIRKKKKKKKKKKHCAKRMFSHRSNSSNFQPDLTKLHIYPVVLAFLERFM